MNNAAAEYAQTVIIATILVVVAIAIGETLIQWWRNR
jgi:hypothetical protein